MMITLFNKTFQENFQAISTYISDNEQSHFLAMAKKDIEEMYEHHVFYKNLICQVYLCERISVTPDLALVLHENNMLPVRCLIDEGRDWSLLEKSENWFDGGKFAHYAKYEYEIWANDVEAFKK